MLFIFYKRKRLRQGDDAPLQSNIYHYGSKTI